MNKRSIQITNGGIKYCKECGTPPDSCYTIEDYPIYYCGHCDKNMCYLCFSDHLHMRDVQLYLNDKKNNNFESKEDYR